MKMYLILVILLSYTTINSVFSFSIFEKEKSAASTLLKLVRTKRENGWMEEWSKKSDLKRECYEETCNYEEAKEYFENYAKDDAMACKMTKMFMKYKNLMRCKGKRGGGKCDAVCMPGWKSMDGMGMCTEDIDECKQNPQICHGGVRTVCMNNMGNYTCICREDCGVSLGGLALFLFFYSKFLFRNSLQL